MRQVSATDLAKMGKCEYQAYLDYHHGQDTSLTAEYIERGNYEHEQFNRRLSGKDKRCFIATAVFGIDAIETNILRQFRDTFLTHYKESNRFAVESLAQSKKLSFQRIVMYVPSSDMMSSN